MGREFATYARRSRRCSRFRHASNVTYSTQGAHTNVLLDALNSNALVTRIGGDLVDPNLVNRDTAHFPKPSVVPASQSADEVCGEAPRLAAVKGGIDNDAGVRFSLGVLARILCFEELPAARLASRVVCVTIRSFHYKEEPQTIAASLNLPEAYFT